MDLLAWTPLWIHSGCSPLRSPLPFSPCYSLESVQTQRTFTTTTTTTTTATYFDPLNLIALLFSYYISIYREEPKTRHCLLPLWPLKEKRTNRRIVSIFLSPRSPSLLFIDVLFPSLVLQSLLVYYILYLVCIGTISISTSFIE